MRKNILFIFIDKMVDMKAQMALKDSPRAVLRSSAEFMESEVDVDDRRSRK